jgi:nucleoside-triphosphatase THEP1
MTKYSIESNAQFNNSINQDDNDIIDIDEISNIEMINKKLRKNIVKHFPPVVS